MLLTKKKNVLIILISLALISISFIHAYRNLALWLFLSDPIPEKLNYICTFAGSSDREPYSLELLKSYKEATWIVNSFRKQLKRWAFQNGIDSNRIVVTPVCNSTLEEITSFREIVTRLESQPKHQSANKHKPAIGFVSSPYHMRRISILFALSRNKAFRKGFFLPVPLDRTPFARGKLQNWWKDKYLNYLVKEEVLKIIGNTMLKIPLVGERIKKVIRK